MARLIAALVLFHTPISLIAGAVTYVVTATALRAVAPDLPTSARR